MSTSVDGRGSRPLADVGRGLRERVRERQRLAREDRTSARLAELAHVAGVLVAAQALVDSGWVQHRWVVRSGAPAGAAPAAAGHRKAHEGVDGPVSAACLVSAVAHAGGAGPGEHPPVVQQALDATWSTLHGEPRHSVDRRLPPALRRARVLDLVTWNDQRGRRVEEVSALLDAARGRVEAHAASLRAR